MENKIEIDEEICGSLLEIWKRVSQKILLHKGTAMEPETPSAGDFCFHAVMT